VCVQCVQAIELCAPTVSQQSHRTPLHQYAPSAAGAIVNRPKVDYTLTVHEVDETGRVYITSPDLPGLTIWAKPELAFADVPIAVKLLRELDAAARACAS
jgi:hypothetical protein